VAVVLSSVGLATPLGDQAEEFVSRIRNQESCIVPLEKLASLQNPNGSMVETISLRSIIKKRKEIKLYTRAAKLGVLAAHRCLGRVREENLGLFVAVGREPPDEGSAEACLIASQKDRRFQETLLADRGRALYPPLLPLRTLPNMILAHISIQLEVMGENACWAGGESMGIQAFRSGFWAVLEGRCRKALVGGADSFISLGAARDLHRIRSVPPSEAGVFFLLEQKEHPKKGDIVLQTTKHDEMYHSLEETMGYAGSVQRLLELVFLIHEKEIVHWGGIVFQKQLL
jgi:3-oxoacyl-(acyl-carrier-protein) synthase